MRLRAISVAWLLPFMLTGCIFHKTQVAQNEPLAPAIEDAPPTKPSPTPTDLPPPEVTVPTQQPATPPTPTPAPKKTTPHKKPAPTNNQQAAVPSPGVSAIGQLSSGDAPDTRQQTDSDIESTERGLNSINRKLSDQETKIADQIREFLKEAKAALTSGDVDGAHTLTIKAKVLLDELRH